MSKKIKFQTKSLGSEPDPHLNTEELVSWIQSRAGRGGDLVRYCFQKPLGYQREAEVDLPCAGGMFYRERLLECLSGIDKGTIIGELGLDPGLLKTDIEEVNKKPDPLWVAMPSPGQLGITDEYYGDPEEVSRNLFFYFRRLMREMRDSGADGHVLICDHVIEEELEALCGKKILFYLSGPDQEGLEMLLEHQRTIAVPCAKIDLVVSLKEEYPVDDLILIDPTNSGLEKTLAHWETGQIKAGGYCRESCSEYWKNIVNAALFQSPSE
jgi:hypothetical protein